MKTNEAIMRALLFGQPVGVVTVTEDVNVNKTSLTLAEYCQAKNEQSFSKPNWCGMKQPCTTTFAYDLGCYAQHCGTVKELKTSIETYLSKIKHLIKGDKEKYCELTNAFNKCSWGCYELGVKDSFTELFGDYYRKFMYNRKTALEYLSENDWEYVRTYLD